ncbi:MAG: DNA adenine methylase [Armatimonadetes bacterium]|nr:DNA adenine methylase [Armatimonadota bacterium]
MGPMAQPSEPARARPFLKWAGGKGQLLPELTKRVPASFGAYHEPFVGGGALFFALFGLGSLSTACLSDINPSLIDAYIAVRNHVDEVIVALRQHRHDERHYYAVRALKPELLPLPERGARTIYLNKTCYNGLHRENRAGQFNVPFGRYKNPTICDEENLRACSRALQRAEVSRRHFSSVLDVARPGDLVYFDPPYHPLSATANFTSYDRSGFGEGDQAQLRDVYAELTRRGVKAMLSNSDTPFIRSLYSDYEISQVHAPRIVNSRASGRGKVPEVIVRNYPAGEWPQGVLSG